MFARIFRFFRFMYGTTSAHKPPKRTIYRP